MKRVPPHCLLKRRVSPHTHIRGSSFWIMRLTDATVLALRTLGCELWCVELECGEEECGEEDGEEWEEKNQ